MTTRLLRVATRAAARLQHPVRAFVARRQRVATLAQRVLDTFPPLQDAVFAVARGNSRARYEAWIAAYDTLSESDFAAMREEQAALTDAPLLSIVVPLVGATEATVEGVAESLSAQVYERWEVAFVGRAADEDVQGVVSRAQMRDPRFRSVPGPTAPLSEVMNSALRAVRSEHVVLVEPDTVLRPHALFLLARTIGRHPDAALIYADEDVLGDAGERCGHYFKPDWNEALMRAHNYLAPLVCLSRTLALAVGGCREDFDGECVWALLLRLGAAAPRAAIHHIPFILSHRRSGADTGVHDRARRQRVASALEQLLAEAAGDVRVEAVGEASYQPHYALPQKPPTVSVIVPSTCNLELLQPCLEGVLTRTTYPQLEVLLVINGLPTPSPEQRAYLDAIDTRPEVRILSEGGRPYNFSRTNNWAAAQARGEVLCFLNDDAEVIESDWLSAMVACVLQDRVAAVGAMLLYPNGRIQHAGIVLGVGEVAGHTYARRPRGINGYHDRALVDQDVSAVSAACMVVRRDAFVEIGGFDEALAVAFNDIDLCLRLRSAGSRIVWTPSAELYHRESASLIRHHDSKRESEWMLELNIMHGRWGDQLRSDPHYSPNLSLDILDLWEPAFPPRVSYPWRADLGGQARAEAAMRSARSA